MIALRNQAAQDDFNAQANPLRLGMLRAQLAGMEGPQLDRVDLGNAIGIVDKRSGVLLGQIPKGATPDAVLRSDTTRRGQDLTATTTREGHAVTRRGQDISATTAAAGHDVTRRGQDITDRRERDVGLQGAIAGAREGARSQAEAAARLPGAVDTANRALRLVDELLVHPGFEGAVGASVGKTLSPFWAPPGTDRRDFEARLGEIKGGAFLQAFETLKGGGQITQIEGEKATQAITRMDTAQSEAEFRTAARDFQNVIRKAVQRARTASGGFSLGSNNDPLGLR